VEYTSIIPAITLFLSAILFFERGKYLLFFVAAFLSVITRQHSIVLLILPLYAVASRSLGRKMVMRFIVYFVFLSACCYLVISNLNVTYAQHHVINKTYKSIEAIPYLKTLLTGAFIYISLLSLFNVLCNGDILKLLKHNIKIFPLPLILTVSLLIHLHFSRHLIINEFGYTYNFLPALILISLWLMDWKLLKPSPLNALAIGYIFLSSFRYIWWDYYFIEVIIISLLVTVRRPETVRFKYLAASVLALILSVNLYCSYHLKVSIDAVELNNIVYEHLERDGAIDVSDMSGATLGFIGWKLFDYYIENEGKNFRGLTAFLGYVKANKIILEHHTPLSKKFKPFGPKTRIMFNGKYNIGFLDLDFRVLDTNFKYYQFSRTGSPLMGINKRIYSNKPFPLSNKEWKHIIESERHM
jgi:hypothetical protein